ncbi:hypothetical protein [Sulfuritalea sp.]|uniref:hypothetical protein n=1 Tax=Sulfuritalea sp. TaxID=2480090 RepID=UPI001ACDFCDF|nr:hypothetical protein [Sulfuritalea sp.]MBN8474309.1 hypothetical protein [Sulfuritalea sp.]
MSRQQDMLPATLADLDRVRAACKSMVRRRAATSGGMSLVPLPGIDIAGDVALLLELIPAINRKFGLTPEQIEELDSRRQVLIYSMLKKVGSDLAGRAITKKLVLLALKKVSARLATKQVLKYIPFAGQAAAAALSVTAMLYLGNSHIDACYEIARGTINK